MTNFDITLVGQEGLILVHVWNLDNTRVDSLTFSRWHPSVVFA